MIGAISAVQMLCVSGVEKRAWSVSGLEAQGRLCGEGGSEVGPCKLFVFRDHWCQRNTFI